MRSSTGIRVCAEPFADTAVQSAIELAAKLSETAKSSAEVAKSENEKASTSGDISGSAEGSLKAATEVVALAGRTQAVLITRELLYRLCEANMNGRLSDADAKALFESTLAVVKSIAATDEKKAEAQAADAKAKLIEAQQQRDDAGAVLACIEARDKCLTDAKDDGAKKACADSYDACIKKVKS
jgi:hypothetical protein